MLVDHSSVLRLRPRQRPAKGERARKPSLLAVKVMVQPLLEIYTAEARFTRKINFFQKIHSLKSKDLWYAGAKNYWANTLGH
jgi:hypothetical protein